MFVHMSLKRFRDGLAGAARSLAGSLRFWRNRRPAPVAGIGPAAGRAVRDAPGALSGAVTDATSSAATAARAIAGDAAGMAGAAANRATRGTRGALGAGRGAFQGAARSVPGLSSAFIASAKAGPGAVSAGAISAASALHSTAQGVLASDLSAIANALVQGAFRGPATIYDRAMDARFIETGIGGSYHRLFDGGHTVSGAFAAARGAAADDTFVQESLGAVLGLLRDMGTPRGLPLATWNQDTFNQVAGTLESTYHIPRSWFADLNTYTGAELLGGAISALAVVFAWNRADTEAFAKLVGGIGVSAVLSANPLLMLMTVAAMARAFHKARRTGEFAEFVDGQARGGLIAGASFAAISAVGVGGGPVGLALLVAVVAGMLANAATSRVSIVQVGRVVSELATALATAAQGARADQYPTQSALSPNPENDSLGHPGPNPFQAAGSPAHGSFGPGSPHPS